MEEGLAKQMVYGSGSSQNTTHYYAGASPKLTLKKKARKKCKKTTKK